MQYVELTIANNLFKYYKTKDPFLDLNEVNVDSDDDDNKRVDVDEYATTTPDSTGVTEKPVSAAPESAQRPVLPPSTDMCRGDDKLPCGNSRHIFICEIQLCDGTVNCPDGEDEENCPDDYGSGERTFVEPLQDSQALILPLVCPLSVRFSSLYRIHKSPSMNFGLALVFLCILSCSFSPRV